MSYVNDPPEDGTPSLVTPLQPQSQPQPQPWYDEMVQTLAKAQMGTREGHASIAKAWRSIAAIGLDIARYHEQLAANVPDAAQAAADLGTAAERHTANNIRAIVRGEQELSILREQEVRSITERLLAVEKALTDVKDEIVRSVGPQPGYWVEAQEMRRRTIEALDKISQKIGTD